MAATKKFRGGDTALLRLGLIVVLLCFLASVPAFAADTPDGNWLTADHNGVIHIAPCGDGYCGQIGSIKLAPKEAMPVDWQGHPQCKLTIVQTTSQSRGDHGPVWQGVVLDPRSGVSHPMLLYFNASGGLVLHGYALIPLLGESTVWTQYAGPVFPDCHFPG
jgi:uncharacterized protein (DUF2147 family)